MIIKEGDVHGNMNNFFFKYLKSNDECKYCKLIF